MGPIVSRLGWMVAGVLALFLISALAGMVAAGPLDPPSTPGSTLQRLSDLSPSWHQVLTSNNGDAGGCNSTRFQCVLGDAAVLDHETGLVWQRTVAGDSTDWGGAITDCETLELGARYGWRLPTHQEIRTLLDDSADHLPDGHPFVGALTGSPDVFWTSTVFHVGSGTQPFVLNFDSPDLLSADLSTGLYRRWCVRGAGESDVRQG